MAQVVLGPLVSDIAGSIGGTTFQRSPWGHTLRRWCAPTSRLSLPRGAATSRFAQAAQLWRTLSDPDRLAWDALAKTYTWTNRFGHPVTGIGYWLFMQANAGSYVGPTANGTMPFTTTAPVSAPATLPARLDLQYDSTVPSLVLASSDAKVRVDTRLHLFASPYVSRGRSSYHGGFRYFATLPPLHAFPVDIMAAWVLARGALPATGATQTFFLRAVAVNEALGWPPRQSVVLVRTGG